MNENFQEVVLVEISHLFDPLLLAAESEEARHRLFEELGWDISAITNFPIADLQTCLNELAAAYTQVETWIETPPTALTQLLPSLDAVRRLVLIIQKLHQILDKPGLVKPAGFEKLAEDLIEFLAVDYLARRSPSTYAIARLLTIITQNGAPQSEIVIDPTTKVVLRYPTSRPKVQLDRIPKLLEDPLALLEAEYMPNGLATYADAQNAAKKLFPPLTTLLELYGIRAMYGLNPTYGISLGSGGDEIAQLSMGFMIALEPDPAFADTGFGATLSFSPTDRGDLGLVISPFGQFSFTQTFQSWLIHLLLEGGLGGFAIHPRHGLQLPDTAQEGHVTFAVQLSKLTNGAGPAFLLGSTQDTRLEIGQFTITTETTLSLNQQEYGVLFEVGSAAFIVSAGDGDGFLQKILPKDGIRVDFDLAIGWSNKRGLYFRGGAGLETTLPVNVDLFGVIKIDSVYLALEAKENTEKKESGIRAAAATTVQVKLGPVSATVERFGLQATLSFPEKGGNLGVANLDLGFKPPNGIGLVIKAQVVTGGGYLYFDFEKEQYAGVLQLEIAQKFSLTAVGLLTTKMPDGKKGFSLLVIISVRFDPGIQLGYGFSLNGLGGLLGVNRIANTEALQEGLRRGALGSILFPQNVVENAPQIISNLSKIFPPAQDRFLFGPMAIIGWGGSPPILSMELGIILEFSESFRLMILGRLRVSLPAAGDGEQKETPKIKLQLDSLGIFDFGSGDISLDAYLYDSTIGPFTITGGMALRASFGAKPMFLLSVGGFHPAFQVPAGFPSIDRVAIGLNKKESGVEFRLQLSAYFALTSNTVQFGAHLDLYVHIAGFVEIIGLLGFDALIQFQPFGVIASFQAMVSVKGLGVTLMAVGLQVNLTGPSPWHVWGKAHFEVLGFKHTAEFSVVTGPAEPTHLPPPTDVEQELLTELRKPSNWSSQLPVGEHPLVTFRDSLPLKDATATPPQKRVLIHPLAELHINQRLVPLKADPITKYGTTTPTGATTFTLTANVAADVKAGSLETKDLSDWFALAQFYVMSDAQKLSAPSFEEKNSGQRVAAGDGYTCGTPVAKTISAAIWEKPTPATQTQPPKDPTADPPPPAPTNLLPQVAHLGAAGQAPIRAAGPAKYGDPTWWGQGITLVKAGYRVVGEEDAGPAPKARATRRAGAPAPASVFEEAMDDMAAIAEPVLSYSAAHARATRARQRSPKRRTWVVPDLGVTRGGR